MKNLVRNLAVLMVIVLGSGSVFSQRGNDDKRPPKDRGKVVEAPKNPPPRPTPTPKDNKHGKP